MPLEQLLDSVEVSNSMREFEFIGEVVQLLQEQQIPPEQYVVRMNTNLYYQIIADNYLKLRQTSKTQSVVIMRFKRIYASF